MSGWISHTRTRLVVWSNHSVGRVAVETRANHLQRKVVLALLAKDESKAIDFCLAELPVTRRRALRLDQSLALKEANLGNRDVGELLKQESEHFADREVILGRHVALSKNTIR